jgi:hypothetical protein
MWSPFSAVNPDIFLCTAPCREITAAGFRVQGNITGTLHKYFVSMNTPACRAKGWIEWAVNSSRIELIFPLHIRLLFA